MKRSWIALLLLSVSWLFGLGYYSDNSWLLWVIAVATGTVLCAGLPIPLFTRPESIAAVIMLLPGIVFISWPYRAAPLLIAIGLLLSIVPIPRRWPKALGSGAVLSGIVLLVQSLAMALYISLTARSHELPPILARMILNVTKFLGAEAALNGSAITMRTVRIVYRLGATWELLLDPVTLCYLTGGIVLLHLVTHSSSIPWPRLMEWTRPGVIFVLLMLLWLPLRAAVMITIFLQRDFRTDYNEPSMLMNQFWNSWLHLALLFGPVLLAFNFVEVHSATRESTLRDRIPSRTRPIVATVLVFIAASVLTMALLWDPPGNRKSGRVLVDEYHSEWEPTERPYDVNWYGPEAGYTYACIYDYCSHFYEMSRLNASLDTKTLQDIDILMVKTPTFRYSLEEIDAIIHFVEQGGGILLIGDHTNVFKTGTCLNDIARRFDFSFRHDGLWDIDTLGDQLYRLPMVSHPIVQNVPLLNFAVGCSIYPGMSRGQAVIRSLGLRNLPANYHVGNFMASTPDSVESRYGAFIQLWTTRYGAGRVAAFTDSTIFSNFATFEPGKAELMLGMLEWLNHCNLRHDPRFYLAMLGVVLFAISLVSARKWAGAWLLILAASILGWTCSVIGAQALHKFCLQPPKANRPYINVVIDRTVCDTPLSKSGVVNGGEDGFGIFERWILRLGYFTTRQHGRNALKGDLLVLLYPNQTVKEEFLDGLVHYVTAGGKVLVLDSPENAASTANSLLYPFGLRVEHDAVHNGQLRGEKNWPSVRVKSAHHIVGGESLMRIGDVAVSAQAQYGKGTVTAIGFGSTFSDANMGKSSEVVPDDNLHKLYNLEFSLLRAIVSEL